MYKFVIVTSNVDEIGAWLGMEKWSGREYEIILINYENKYKNGASGIDNLRMIVNSPEELNSVLDRLLLEDIAIIINSAIETNDIISHREVVKYVEANSQACYGRVWFYVPEAGERYKDFKTMFPEKIVEASLNFKTNGCDLELPKEEVVLLPSKFKYSVFDKFGKINADFVTKVVKVADFLKAVDVADFPGMASQAENIIMLKGFTHSAELSLFDLLTWTEELLDKEASEDKCKFIEHVVYRLQGTKHKYMEKMNLF